MQYYHIHLSPFWTYAAGVELSGSSIPYEGVTHDPYEGKHYLTLFTWVSLVLGVAPTNKIIFGNKSILTMAILQSVTHSTKNPTFQEVASFQISTGRRKQTAETSFCLYSKHRTHCRSLFSLPYFNTHQKSWGPNNSDSN